jgi:hypothetical protein
LPCLETPAHTDVGVVLTLRLYFMFCFNHHFIFWKCCLDTDQREHQLCS